MKVRHSYLPSSKPGFRFHKHRLRQASYSSGEWLHISLATDSSPAPQRASQVMQNPELTDVVQVDKVWQERVSPLTCSPWTTLRTKASSETSSGPRHVVTYGTYMLHTHSLPPQLTVVYTKVLLELTSERVQVPSNNIVTNQNQGGRTRPNSTGPDVVMNGWAQRRWKWRPVDVGI